MGFLDIRAEIGDLEGGFARASDSVVMILTCPECATGYFVDDAQMRPGGRAVRCAACGARWNAQPEGPLDLVSTPEDSALGKAPVVETAKPAPLTGEDLPRQFRTRAEDERRMRSAAMTGALWAGVALVVVAVLGAAVIFRGSVVRVWPRTASVYASLGMPVNPIGLVVEQVKAEPSLKDGHPVLEISGVIHSVSDRIVSAPPLRISLMNADGKRVAGVIAAFSNGQVPPGAVRHFTTYIIDPPFSSQDGSLQVEFAPDAKGDTTMAGGAKTAPPPPIELRGPAFSDQPDAGNVAAASNVVVTVPAPPPPAAPPPPSNSAAAGSSAGPPTTHE